MSHSPTQSARDVYYNNMLRLNHERTIWMESYSTLRHIHTDIALKMFIPFDILIITCHITSISAIDLFLFLFAIYIPLHRIVKLNDSVSEAFRQQYEELADNPPYLLRRQKQKVTVEFLKSRCKNYINAYRNRKGCKNVSGQYCYFDEYMYRRGFPPEFSHKMRCHRNDILYCQFVL